MVAYYTGVGSRDISQRSAVVLTYINKILASEGLVLRSGAANGADSICEIAYRKATTSSIDPYIYLPYNGFNGRRESVDSNIYVGSNCDTWERAIALAKSVHPAKQYLTGFALLAHARNCYQVLGHDLETPSKILVCAAPYDNKDGYVTGGTKTAYKLAVLNDIPVINVVDEWFYMQIDELLQCASLGELIGYARRKND